ncbi:hypothetical protein IGI04_004496 [Brassica rapa subsp. trilocularis]|uniref:Uncharacterized protein n=1 Tax=Brassica rapa subsp. trilocularis TaxID=1813537 RepID=A0ABQ7NB91_BRACM|nr:hypothetical protein IGI04_004496 [Brassica rapa subsp. trilocularis]
MVEYIGEDGELVIRNPVRNSAKPGKDFCKFKLIKFILQLQLKLKCLKTEPLVRSVMDGFNKNIKKKKKQSCKKILGPIKRFDGDVVEYLKVMLLSLVHKSRAGGMLLEIVM